MKQSDIELALCILSNLCDQVEKLSQEMSNVSAAIEKVTVSPKDQPPRLLVGVSSPVEFIEL